MDVKLIVASGKNAGQVIPIKGSKFFIGRAEDCHLRPRSDLVSRHHCVIVVEDGAVSIRDFGSKNGTLVNGERVKTEQDLHNGDRLTVGQLEFTLELTVETAGQKKPVVQDLQEAAARTVKASLDDDLDISELLGEEEAEAPVADMDTKTLDVTLASASSPDTTVETSSQTAQAESDSKDGSLAVSEKEKEERRRAEIVGVSETTRKRRTAATSRDAAAEALKNFFKGRR